MFTNSLLLYKQMCKQNKALERFEIAVVFLLFQRSSVQSCLQLSFEIPFIVRVGNVSVVRERVKLVCYSTAHSAFCRVESDLLYELLSPMYYSQGTCTFNIDF